MSYLVDTCVISELTRKRPDTRVVGWVEGQDEWRLFLSVLTLGELWKGIAKLPPGDKRNRLLKWVDEDLTERFAGRILDVDLEVANRWGEISGAAEREGRKIPVLDGLLGATALVAGLTLVTRNAAHVEAAGVPVLNPWDQR